MEDRKRHVIAAGGDRRGIDSFTKHSIKGEEG
jgi:hypothetical protein